MTLLDSKRNEYRIIFLQFLFFRSKKCFEFYKRTHFQAVNDPQVLLTSEHVSPPQRDKILNTPLHMISFRLALGTRMLSDRVLAADSRRNFYGRPSRRVDCCPTLSICRFRGTDVFCRGNTMSASVSEVSASDGPAAEGPRAKNRIYHLSKQSASGARRRGGDGN